MPELIDWLQAAWCNALGGYRSEKHLKIQQSEPTSSLISQDIQKANKDTAEAAARKDLPGICPVISELNMNTMRPWPQYDEDSATFSGEMLGSASCNRIVLFGLFLRGYKLGLTGRW